jgi:Flp pilus assembly secretin CpaC
MRNGNVALTIDLKIDALSGSALNGNPILANRTYSGVVQLREGEGVAIVSELDKQQSRAISGTPGLSEIPGLNEASSNDRQSSDSTLLIVISPHIVRNAQPAGHTPIMPMNLGAAAQ